MSDADHIRSVYARYPELVSKGDLDGVVELYAEDATLEDPIGSELRRGHDAIREFYRASAGKITIRCTGPVRVVGREAATPMVVLFGPPGPEQRALDVISLMSFDEDGKITAMRAYWSFDAMRSARDADR